MTLNVTRTFLFAAALTLPFSLTAQQVEGPVLTQALLRSDAKVETPLTPGNVTLELNGRPASLAGLTAVQPGGTQVALLIDDGLSRSAAVQINDLRQFVSSLPPETEVLVGYMTNGRVSVLVPFTTDHVDAAAKIRIPFGVPGQSGSPYFCLSDFVKRWPGRQTEVGLDGRRSKARFVMMVTDGVDPYYATRQLSQDSPYVQAAIEDSQRAGVAVSSIFYSDAGIGGGLTNLSGQGYLKQVADGTGGEAYYQGSFNPVSLSPFLAQFRTAIAETYVASFSANATGKNKLVRLKLTSSVPKAKLRYPDAIRPGNVEAPVEQ